MKVTPALRDSPRMIWLLALVILGGGYYGIATRYDGPIAQSVATSERLRKVVDANRLAIAGRVILERLSRRIENDFTNVGAGQEVRRLTPRLLTAIDALAVMTGVIIKSVELQPQTFGLAGAPKQLIRVPVTIAASGTFSMLLRFIQELPRQHTLIGIDGMQLGRRHRNGRRWLLDAQIHAALYEVRLKPSETQK